ncbi:MAG: TonB-dependent receptor [Kordiimonadaceae bacterium]|nr:TonB-dependent receptor [Kordiimonadaceae bacterium]
MKKLLLLSVSLPSLVAADLASAQQAQNEDVLTVVGSRVKGRTALDSNVPVDVIQATELAATPSLNMKDAMTAVSPSFSVDRSAVGDANTLVRGSSLRGLNQGEVLTLLNGKRMHRSAVIHTDGWQAADLGSISINSIKSIEILRDGAAAQYGADAVAGVVNIVLDDSEGISGQADFSQYYEGDGFAYQLASKAGISLADRGFLTVTAAYAQQDATNRAGPHLNALDQIAKWNRQEAGKLSGSTLKNYNGKFLDPAELNPATIAPYGIAASTQFNVSWNSEMEIGENSSVYAFGTFTRKHVKEPFNFRAGLPLGYSTPGVGGNSGASRQVTYGMNDYIYLNGLQAWNENAYLLGMNPDGSPLVIDGVTQEPFAGLFTHPNGYNPWYEMDLQDLGAYMGFKGEFDNGLTYDLWGSVGRSRVDNFISDTHNPSLGAPKAADGSIDYANVQTAFYIGSQVNIERQVGLDMVYTVDTDAVESLNVAFGGTYRTDQYYNVVGEKNSWFSGPLAGPSLSAFASSQEAIDLGLTGANALEGGRGLNVGSDGFGGFSPDTYFNASRSNYAVYLDIESDVTEDFNIDVAGRYEDFTDFGDNFSWKIAARYQLIEDLLAVRAAASTGFHAPTVGILNNTQVRTGFRADGSQTQTGTFTYDSIPGQVFGIMPVGPELARNLSAGFVLTPGDSTNITVDAFQIKLRESLATTPTFDVEDYAAQFAQIASSGFQGAATLTGVDFPTNEGSRRVRGIEVVASHNIDLDNSTLRLVLAYAYVQVKYLEHSLYPRDLFNAEHEQAPQKATFTATWTQDAWSIMGRARWWATRLSNAGLDASGTFIGTLDDDSNPRPLSDFRIDKNPGRVFFDLAVTYNIDEQFSVTVGADNILNTYPLRQPEVVETSMKRGRQYLTDGVDWQGGSYYARIKANF